MEPVEFLDWIVPEARGLQRKYHLDQWDIALRVVPDDELHPRHAAEVGIQEEYRHAKIYLSETLVRNAPKEILLKVVDHELQHVFLHPIDALKNLVLDAVPEALRNVVSNEFGRTNERIRASLEHLLSNEPHLQAN